MHHATGLRCVRHFNQNCKDKLHKLGIQRKPNQSSFLKGDDWDGILDAKDKKDLKNRLTEAKEPLDKEEQKLTGGKAPEFWNYIKAHKKMMKTNMIASSRLKAGMPLDSSGTPLKSYTNKSESINDKLTRQKGSHGKNQQK